MEQWLMLMTIIICSGHSTICSCANIICSRLNIICSVHNIVCCLDIIICRCRNSICSGHNNICSHDSIICSDIQYMCFVEDGDGQWWVWWWLIFLKEYVESSHNWYCSPHKIKHLLIYAIGAIRFKKKSFITKKITPAIMAIV